MKNLLTVLCSYLQQGRPLAMATVVRQHGSTPRGAGARLLANERGLVFGTVGGGLLESMALDACAAALSSGHSQTLTLDMSGEMAANADMICGGNMRVLVEPLHADAETLQLYQTMRHHLEEGGSLLVKGLDKHIGISALFTENEILGDPLPADMKDQVQECRKRGLSSPCLLACDNGEFYIEPLLPPTRMIIAGGGHVAVATARLAAMTGFEVIVLDDRPDFSDPARFPWASHTRTVPDFLHCFQSPSPNVHTFIVIATRGHTHDSQVLAQALRTQAGYIGMIGSKRKRDQVYTQMLRDGFAQSDLDRVFCPIGIDICAETPEEIALSVVAECVQFKRCRARERETGK